MAALETAQKRWQEIQKQLSTSVANRQKLESQLQENTSVHNEFSSLSPEAKIYKAHGPLLLQQSLAEASELVGKRLEFIRGEIDRVEGTLKELEGKGQQVRSEILMLSNEPVKRPGQ